MMKIIAVVMSIIFALVSFVSTATGIAEENLLITPSGIAYSQIGASIGPGTAFMCCALTTIVGSSCASGTFYSGFHYETEDDSSF